MILLEISNMTSKERHLELLEEFERGARRHFEEGEFISSGEVRDGEKAREALEWMERIISYCIEKVGK